MNWRTNTLAEKPGHRHEHTQAAWKPSDSYVPRPLNDQWPGWAVFLSSVVSLALSVAVLMGLAFVAVEIAKWIK